MLSEESASSGQSFSIRDATSADLDAMVALWIAMMDEHQAFDARVRLAKGAETGYRAYLGYHLGNEESLVSVAVGGRTAGAPVIGFCLSTINRNLPMFLPARYGYLSDLVIAPAERRRGIGRALVADVRRWLKRRRVDTIQLQVYARNEGGAAFWKSMGFVSYYDRMWLDLG